MVFQFQFYENNWLELTFKSINFRRQSKTKKTSQFDWNIQSFHLLIMSS